MMIDKKKHDNKIKALKRVVVLEILVNFNPSF